MYTIKAKLITAENFKPYGTFASMLNPTGPSLGDFYNDQVEFPVSGNLPIAYSSLISRTEGDYGEIECGCVAFGSHADTFGYGTCDDYIAGENL